MTVNFNGKEIELKYSFRAMIMYENAVGESFSGTKGVTESIMYFYCIVVSSAKDYTIQLDDVIDWLDDNPGALVEFGQWMQVQLTNQTTVKKNSKKTSKVTKK